MLLTLRILKDLKILSKPFSEVHGSVLSGQF